MAHIWFRFRPLPQLMQAHCYWTAGFYAVTPLQTLSKFVSSHVKEIPRGLVIVNHTFETSKRQTYRVSSAGGRKKDPTGGLKSKQWMILGKAGRTLPSYAAGAGLKGSSEKKEPGPAGCIVNARKECRPIWWQLSYPLQLDSQTINRPTAAQRIPRVHEQLWGSLAGPFVLNAWPTTADELNRMAGLPSMRTPRRPVKLCMISPILV